MTDETAAAVSKVAPSPFPSDPIFDFDIKEWVDPPLLVPHKDVSSAELKRRQQNEHVYRSKVHNPTHWYRYLVLVRSALSGSAFDMLMNHPAEHVLKIHRILFGTTMSSMWIATWSVLPN